MADTTLGRHRAFSMALPNLFESTESVVSLLWDVALAVFVIRIAFVYAVLEGAGTAVLLWLGASSPPARLLVVRGAALALAAAASARFCVALFDIPRVASFRLAIGATAVVYGALGGLAAHVLGPAAHAHCGHASGGALHAALAVGAAVCTALMPWLSMVLLEPAAPRRTWPASEPASTKAAEKGSAMVDVRT